MVHPSIQAHIESMRREAEEHERQAKEHSCLADKLKRAILILAAELDESSLISTANGWSLPPAIASQMSEKKRSGTRGDKQPLKRWQLIAQVIRDEGGREMPVPAIVDELLRRGDGNDLVRSNFFNAVYTAMKRRDDVFRQNRNGTWSLTGSFTEAVEPGTDR